jgi:hypothetical protein
VIKYNRKKWIWTEKGEPKVLMVAPTLIAAAALPYRSTADGMVSNLKITLLLTEYKWEPRNGHFKRACRRENLNNCNASFTKLNAYHCITSLSGRLLKIM